MSVSHLSIPSSSVVRNVPGVDWSLSIIRFELQELSTTGGEEMVNRNTVTPVC